jgi:hypothetical protein
MSRTSKYTEQRSVSFVETAISQIYHIPPLDDYTPAEIATSWYNDEEIKEMERKCHKIIKKMKKGEAERQCTRGLERTTGARKQQVKRNRKQAYDAVLDEQDAQRSQGRSDPNTISEVYFFEVSYLCQLEATKLGQLDAMVVRSYLSQSEAETFMRDVDGNTPMDHAKNLPHSEVRAMVMNTMDSDADNILVAAERPATLLISHEHESRTRELKEARVEYVRQLEARHNEEKINFLQLELKFQTELAEEKEKERSIFLAEILEENETKAKRESDEAHTLLAAERIHFRSTLQSQERDMRIIIDEAIGKVERFEKQICDQQSFVEKLEEKAKECDENRAKLAATNNALKEKDNTLIHLNQLLSTKEHQIRELHQQLEEKKAAERVSSKQVELLSTLQSAAQHKLDTTRVENEQLRNHAEMLEEQLFEANRKFDTQEHLLGSVKSLVASLSYSLQTGAVDVEFEKNLDTHSDDVVEGMEAVRQRTTRKPRSKQRPNAIGTRIPKTIGTTKLSSLTIVTSMPGEMGLSHFGSGKYVEETATASTMKTSVLQEDEDNYTLASAPSPVRAVPTGLNHKQHRLV